MAIVTKPPMRHCAFAENNRWAAALHLEVQIRASWVQCADEGAECACTGKVFYGRKFVSGKPGTLASIMALTSGAYKEQTVLGSVTCSSAAMGGDPAPGFFKYCLCQRGTADWQTVSNVRVYGESLFVHDLSGHRSTSVRVVLNAPQRLLLARGDVERSAFYHYHSGLFSVSQLAGQSQPSRYGIAEIQVRGIIVAEGQQGIVKPRFEDAESSWTWGLMLAAAAAAAGMFALWRVLAKKRVPRLQTPSVQARTGEYQAIEECSSSITVGAPMQTLLSLLHAREQEFARLALHCAVKVLKIDGADPI